MAQQKQIKPTDQEYREYYDKLIAKFRQDPKYELSLELGGLLMINSDDFTLEQQAKYDELITLIK